MRGIHLPFDKGFMFIVIRKEDGEFKMSRQFGEKCDGMPCFTTSAISVERSQICL